AAMTQEHKVKLLHLSIKRIAQLVSRIDPHRIRQPLDHAPAAPSPLRQLFKRVRAIRINGDDRLKLIRLLSRKREDVFVRHVELRLRQIRRPIASVILIERQQAILAVPLYVFDETREPRGKLSVRLLYML